jgi:hypothetical protein
VTVPVLRLIQLKFEQHLQQMAAVRPIPKKPTRPRYPKKKR